MLKLFLDLLDDISCNHILRYPNCVLDRSVSSRHERSRKHPQRLPKRVAENIVIDAVSQSV